MPTTQSHQALDRDLFDRVREVLLSLEIEELGEADIQPEANLIDDIGLDSLRFVDLTVNLEEALGIPVFPMQEWVDLQVEHERPLTVAELVAVCEAVVAGEFTGASS